MNNIFNYLFYVAYVSIIVLFGSLNGHQLTDNLKKTFNFFGLTALIVISLDITNFILGSTFVYVREILLYIQVINMFIILLQLRKAKLNKVSIFSYMCTLIFLITYCIYPLFRNFFHF